MPGNNLRGRPALNKEIVYTEEKRFSQVQVRDLFLSVGWVSGLYPGRLYKALMQSSTVITAWDGGRLVGLVRLIDDGEMLAYLHYVLVDPAYQGRGIAGTMIEMVKVKYKNYLYIECMPEESKNAAFYEKHGFHRMADAAALQICNYADKR
jgi:ribosomal protein S18 acetylase RimI-like enzyme